VRVTLAFGFGNEQQLGWDPTMTLTDDAKPKTIQMGADVYTVEGIISNDGANSLLGRATRVFRVKDSNGQINVIKDVWKDVSRKREDAI
jgi:Fungal protein kinase